MVLIITTSHDQPAVERLLGGGSRWGMAIQYAIQPSPDGLAQAFLIGADFLDGAPAALVLGDNLFHGHDLVPQLAASNGSAQGTTVYAYPVSDPEHYGVVAFDAEGLVTSLEEKPAQPQSRYALTGPYFYDALVVERARRVQPSARGELAITDLNRRSLEKELAETVHWFLANQSWLETLRSRSGYRGQRLGLKPPSPELATASR